MRFPPEFDRKVNMDKVALPVIKKWIAERILAILGFEDDILVQFIFNMLDSAKEAHQSPDPKHIQIHLTGFLEQDARAFTEELWTHLVTACHNAGGIPTAMLEATKKKLAMKSKIESYRDSEVKNEGLERTGRAKATDEVKIKKEVESSESNKQSNQLKEMLENIERKRKEREKKMEQIKAIPKSLADCIASSIVQKAKMQEDRELRAELKKRQAMVKRTKDVKVVVKKEQSTPESSPERNNIRSKTSTVANPLQWEPVKREPNVEQPRRSRSRSRKRRRTRSRTFREESPSPSPSPSPPREWLSQKSKRASRRRRRSPSSSLSSD